MISGQDKISILLTFFVGMFAGGYLYLTGFATTFEPPEASEANIYTQFVITAESYGDCVNDKTCLSFQVLENGTFRAVHDGLGDQKTEEGRIALSLRSDLKTALTPATLAEIARETGRVNCRYEGTNYRFTITRDEVEYTVDTCTSAIDYEDESWLVLAKLWNYVGTLDW